LLLLPALWALQGGVAFAAPPVNDAIENATPIGSVPFTDTVSIAEATTSPSDPFASCTAPQGTVWYRYDAPVDQPIRVNAPGGGAVPVTYAGVPGALTQVGCGGNHVVYVTAGSTYYIALKRSTPGPSTATLTVQVATPPTNDFIENATPIGSLPFSQTQTTLDATNSPSDPPSSCIGVGTTVWYRYDASQNALLRLTSTFSGATSGILPVTYVGSPGALTQVGCGLNQLLSVEAGSSYYIALKGTGTATVTLNLQVATPPANDLIANATPIASLPFSQVQTTLDATRSASDPAASCVGFPQATVWYRYDAPADALLRITSSSVGGVSGALPATYVGTPDSLSQVGCGTYELVPVEAGSSYYIVLHSSSTTTVTLNVQVATPPANDRIENATIVPSLPFSTPQQMIDATSSDTDPAASCVSGSGPTVWFRYDAPVSGAVRVSASGPVGGTAVSYEGSPGSLTEATCGTGAFAVTAGSSYYIAIRSSFQAPVTVSFQAVTPPANDRIENATPVSLPFANTENTATAARSASDPPTTCFGGSYSTVWFRYDAPTTQLLRLSNSVFSGGFVVYDASDSMTQVSCVNSFPQSVAVTGGHAYYFMGVTFPGGQSLGLNAVLLDNAPALSAPSDISVEATSPYGTVVEFTATATDVEDGDLTPSCRPESGSTFGMGETRAYCYVVDSFGMSTLHEFTVTVVDTTAPVLNVPNHLTVDATLPSGAVVDLGVSATDNGDVYPIVDCVPSSGSPFAIGDTSVTCQATDASGNSSSASFSVHVNSASEQLAVLRAGVQSSTTGGIRNGLTSKVDDAISGVAAGNTNKACGSLTDFAGLAQAQSGKGLPAATAQQFVTDATRIKAVIGCKK